MSATTHGAACCDVPLRDLRAIASRKPYGRPRSWRKRTSDMAALALAIVACIFASYSIASEPLAVIAPPPAETLSTTLYATGVQIYECREKKDGGYAWAFVAPEALLHDASGRRVGTHGAGPHWRADDGSAVVGTVVARVDAPERVNIPWLLLSTRSTGSDGALAGVTSIQRVNTAGGAPPAVPCTAHALGATGRVAYTADYRLHARRVPLEMQ